MAIDKPNYTQIPNIFIDYWMSKLSPPASMIFLVICRKTIGWSKDHDQISLSQMEKITGLSTNTVRNGIQTLIESDLITQIKTGSGRASKTFFELKMSNITKPIMSKSDTLKKNVSKSDIIDGVNVSESDMLNRFNVSKSDNTKEILKEILIKERGKIAGLNIVNSAYDYSKNLESFRIAQKILAQVPRQRIEIIQQCLEPFSGAEIIQAFTNYEKIMTSSEYVNEYPYRSVESFLTKGIGRFIDSEKPLERHKVKPKSESEMTAGEYLVHQIRRMNENK